MIHRNIHKINSPHSPSIRYVVRGIHYSDTCTQIKEHLRLFHKDALSTMNE